MRAAVCATLIGISVLGFARAKAAASPMEDTTLGGAVFTGPTQGHASSIFVNPAALGFSAVGKHFYIGGNARLSSVFLDRRVLSTTGQLSNGPSETIHTIIPGGLVAYFQSLQEGSTRIGVALSTPTIERFAEGGENFGYHTEGGYILQSMVTLAGSYQATSKLIFGLAVSAGYTTASFRFSRDTALDDGSAGINANCSDGPCGYEHPDNRERISIDGGSEMTFGGSFTLSASVGAAVMLPGNGWLGIGYVAMPGAFGKTSLQGTATVQRAPVDGGGTEDAFSEFGFRGAQLVFVGYRHPIGRSLNAVLHLRWQDWSRHNQFDIRLFGGNLGTDVPEWILRYRGYQDVWRLSAGIETDQSEAYRFGVRLRSETAATPTSAITPLQMGGNNFTLATGTELRFLDHWVLGMGYELSWSPSKDTQNSQFDPRAFVDCVDSNYDFDSCDSARQGSGFATGEGRYQKLQHGLVMSLRYDSL